MLRPICACRSFTPSPLFSTQVVITRPTFSYAELLAWRSYVTGRYRDRLFRIQRTIHSNSLNSPCIPAPFCCLIDLSHAGSEYSPMDEGAARASSRTTVPSARSYPSFGLMPNAPFLVACSGPHRCFANHASRTWCNLVSRSRILLLQSLLLESSLAETIFHDASHAQPAQKHVHGHRRDSQT